MLKCPAVSRPSGWSAAPETLEKHSPCSRVHVSACSDASLCASPSKAVKLHFLPLDFDCSFGQEREYSGVSVNLASGDGGSCLPCHRQIYPPQAAIRERSIPTSIHDRRSRRRAAERPRQEYTPNRRALVRSGP